MKDLIQLICKTVKFRTKYLVYEEMGAFGTAPFRIAEFMILVVLVFSCIYWITSNIFHFFNESSMLYAVYHSVITFLTIGYGQDFIIPTNIFGVLLSGLEGFLGLFLMSYFTAAFVRKVSK